MMAGLFLIFAIVMILLITGYRKAAMILAVINLILCLLMFWHHVTDTVKIML